jgi:hypothetical protein
VPGFSIQGGAAFTPNSKAEFHRQHRWIIDNLGDPGMPIERLYAQSVQLPSLTFDEEQIKTGSTITYKIAKKANWQDFTIKFYDVYGLHKLFENWQRKIWNQTGGIGKASDYKSQVIIKLTDGDGATKQTYTAHGAYPKSITHGDLSYTSNEIKLLTVTYSYDYAVMKFEDGGSDPSSGPVNQGGSPPTGLEANRQGEVNNSTRRRIEQNAVGLAGGPAEFADLGADDQSELLDQARSEDAAAQAAP